ncbi:MAG TPA: HD domain-containing phosphohydrolase [Blastocatellia bacterium]|nr:HD domain-containing phosphohydrolase [Blastocatellia bacterium]
MQANLLQLSLNGNARSHQLNGKVFRIGRHEDNDLSFDNPYISRHHAEIVCEGAYYVIRDLGSTSGTFVNYERVKQRRLRDGDRIRLGRGHGIELAFQGPSPEGRAKETAEEANGLPPVCVLAPDEARFIDTSRLPKLDVIAAPTLERLRALYEFSSEALATQSVQETGEKLVAYMRRTLKSERCAVLFYNRHRGMLEIAVAHPEEKDFKPSRSISERAYKDNVAVLSFDALQDDRFRKGDSIRLQSVRSVMCAPIGSRNRVWGVCYVDNLSPVRVFNEEELEFLTALARQAGLAMENLYLIEEQRRSLDSFVRTLAATLDAKDDSTAGHSARVGSQSAALARAMGLSPAEARLIYYAGLLHDYGKIGIRDDVLLKPAQLTPEEYEYIKQHPVHTFRLLSKIRFPEDLAAVPAVAAAHHERWDGTGYPEGLKGDEIPIGSRIVAVIDAYDAITKERVYNEPVSPEKALQEIKMRAGTHFDPAVVEAFAQYFQREIEPRKRRRKRKTGMLNRGVENELECEPVG